MNLTKNRSVSRKVIIPIVLAVVFWLLAAIALCVYFFVLTSEVPHKLLLPDEKICGNCILEKIYGGNKTGLDEFPWMVLLEYKRKTSDGYLADRKHVFCHGVLISKRYILTAAHCIKGRDIEHWTLVSVRLGEHDTNSEIDCLQHPPYTCAPPAVSIDTEEPIVHEEYDPDDVNQHHDIALLRLKKEVAFTGYISPICLPLTQNLRSKDYMGKKLFLAGWGLTQHKRWSSVKLKVKVPVKNQSHCMQTYQNEGFRLMKGQICAGGEEHKDSCTGDSGGPLMTVESVDGKLNVNWYAIGIVSFGRTPCGKKDTPAVYTSVAAYVDWILVNLQP